MECLTKTCDDNQLLELKQALSDAKQAQARFREADMMQAQARLREAEAPTHVRQALWSSILNNLVPGQRRL